MEQPFRVAIVGCGWAGRRHARAFQGIGAQLVWAVDVEQGRAQALRDLDADIRTSTEYSDPLKDPQVEAVDVCLPHDLHAEVCVEAADAGKHILCEKPIAASLGEADRMLEAADRAGVVLMIAENVRFTPLYCRIRDLLRDGVIGRPALIQMTRECYLTESFLEDRRWFLDAKAAAGGIMMSGGVHDFETMRMLIGEVECVQALRARQRFLEMEGDDTSIAMVRFHDGTVGTLVESFVMKTLTTAAGSEVHTLRIDGDLGSLSACDGRTIQLFSERRGYLPGGELAQHTIRVPEEDTFRLEVQHFVDSVRTGESPLTSGRSQRRPLEIVLAAYDSMQSGGQPVRVG